MKSPRLIICVALFALLLAWILSAWHMSHADQSKFDGASKEHRVDEVSVRLISAILDKDKVRLEAVLKSGISANHILNIPSEISSSNRIEGVDSALGLAVLTEDADCVEVLLRYGAIKTHRDLNGDLPVHNATNLSNIDDLSPGFIPSYTTLIDELCSRFKLIKYAIKSKEHPFNLCSPEILTRMQLKDISEINDEETKGSILSISIILDLRRPDVKKQFTISCISGRLDGNIIAGEVWFLHGAWFVEVTTLGNI